MEWGLKNIIIVTLILLGCFIAFVTPYVEMGKNYNFNDYDSSLELDVADYKTEINIVRNSSQTFKEDSGKIGPASEPGSDETGELIKSAFKESKDSVSMTTKMPLIIGKSASKAQIPGYWISIILGIIFTVIAFSIVKLALGRD